MSGLSLSSLPGYEGLRRVWAALPQARLVGGCVRDLLCGVALHDLDLATPEPPDEVQSRLEGAGIRVIPTGLSHGTVTALIEGTPYEITTLRRDEQTDGRHAVVAWTQDWREDAARRDFTINAMSLDQNGAVHDYFGGRADLTAGKVRFVGDASRRIEEDALRILRFFRFTARYGRGDPDGQACRAIEQGLDGLRRLSAERVTSELMNILSGPSSPPPVQEVSAPEQAVPRSAPASPVGVTLETVLAWMERMGVLSSLLPPREHDALRRLLACGGPAEPLLRLYALCPQAAASERLRLSKAERKRLAAFAETEPVLSPAMSDDDLRRARAAESLPVLIDRSWLSQARDVAAPDSRWDRLRGRLTKTPQPEFPLTGRDAQAEGVRSGPETGAWLARGRGWWLRQGCRPGREDCLIWLRQSS